MPPKPHQASKTSILSNHSATSQSSNHLSPGYLSKIPQTIKFKNIKFDEFAQKHIITVQVCFQNMCKNKKSEMENFPFLKSESIPDPNTPKNEF